MCSVHQFTTMTVHPSIGAPERAAVIASNAIQGVLPARPVALVNPMPPVPWVGILPAEIIKSLRGLSPSEKAERIGDWIGWSGGEEYKDDNGMPLWCAASPISGRHYLISYSVAKGAYVCNCDGCRKHGDCYHLESWYAMFGEVAAPFLKAREEAARERAAAPAACLWCKDSGTVVSGGSRYRCTCAAGKGRVAA